VSRTTIVIVAVVAGALCAALVVVLVWRPFDDQPPIQTQALGVWQEQTASLPVRLTVSARGEDGDAVRYWITYPSMSDVPFPGRLDGDSIVVRSTNDQDVLWAIRYDEGADALIVRSTGGEQTYILRRISE
jgi:hypothetical protein